MATGFFKKQFEDFEDFKRSDIDRHKFTLDNSSILSSSQVSVDGQIVVQISFKTGSAEYSFLLLKGIYIKRKFLAKLQLTLVPDDKDLEKEIPLLEEITLYQHFLSKSPAFIYDSDFLFNIDSRILLCQSFIELLEENNLHLSQYRDTYIALLRLNFELAEQSCYSQQNKMSEKGAKNADNLFYALKRWLNACKDIQYTIFEDEEIDREEEIHKAIFQDNGKVKEYFCESKAGEKNDERFQSLLRRIADDWFLKSMYDLKSARKIYLQKEILKKRKNNVLSKKSPRGHEGEKSKTEKKRQIGGFWLASPILFLVFFIPFLLAWKVESLRVIVQVELPLIYFGIPAFCIILFLVKKQLEFIKMFILRMVGAIVVGYTLLIITQDVWEFSLRYYQKSDIVAWEEYVFIIIIALALSLFYLFNEVNNVVKKFWIAFKRACSLFLIGAGQSLLIGLVLFDLFADGMVDTPIINLGIEKCAVTTLNGFVGHIYPLPLILYASLALVIGIFIQILWEDKPITQPL